MAVALAVEFTGTERVLERIAALEERVGDLGPPLTIVADLLEAHVARTFATQGAWIGMPWAPLAIRTVRSRLKRWGYYGRWAPAAGAAPQGPALLWHGRLRGSFRRGGVAHIRQVSASGLAWGSGVRYGVFHQSTLPRLRLPRRPMLEFRDAFQEREILFQPVRLWLQGVPAGAIATVMHARLRL